MRIQFTMLLFLLFVASQASAGKIYTWKDADGQVHFSSMPPPQVDVKTTGLTTGESSNNNAPAQSNSTTMQQRLNAVRNHHATNDSLAKQKQGGAEFSKMMQDARRQQANRAKSIDYSKTKNRNWQSDVIKKCQANRGVDCTDSHYVQSKRPLSDAERAELNRQREARRQQNISNKFYRN